MKISVVIVTRNREIDLEKALCSVIEQEFEAYELIVVDNNSNDETKERVMRIKNSSKIPITYLGLKTNKGATGGRNRAFKLARGKYLYFLDDDGYLEDRKFLLKVYNFLEEHPKVGCMGTRIYNTKGDLYQKATYIKKDRLEYYDAFSYIGASHVFRSSIFKEDENIYPESIFYLNEETYAAIKTLNKGYKVIYHPGFEAIHSPSKFSRLKKDDAKFRNIVNGVAIKRLLYPPIFFPLIYILFFLRIVKNFGLKASVLKEAISSYRKKILAEDYLPIKLSTVYYLISRFGFLKFINW
jgi:glycosyltransferase involved in cell wall biosynthesis